jgi:GMP synthase (glutamine-hydrolysing)
MMASIDLGFEFAMESVLILQFIADDAPAYLGTWLQRQGIAAELRQAASGPPFPERIEGYRALALLGGSMSVNDDLPFLRSAERLIEQAIAADIPVLGHCLGGQLMAKTLGAAVGGSPAPEIGWHRMDCIASPASEAWFGPQASQTVFHWHYEAFALPAGAVRLASSPQCPNQAFAYRHHLAMQFHVEADAAKVDLWLSQHDPQYIAAQRTAPTVHAERRVRVDSIEYLPAQHRLADRIYGRWLAKAQ